MNPHISDLQPYPFQRLAALLGEYDASAADFVNLSIGEPKHPTPQLVLDALVENLDKLGAYPSTLGLLSLRKEIADWIKRRFGADIDPSAQVLPVLGSREALFSFAQATLSGNAGSKVGFPNPFYQIYEGAAFLGCAEPVYLNIDSTTGLPDWKAIDASTLDELELLYVCSPNNPTGSVITLEQWEYLFSLSDQHGFVIASDECYSEIYIDEANPPMGALQAASLLGRGSFQNLVVFSSLSKRSNAPGLRSGFVAGDANLISTFLKYRTYHGSAMSVPTQYASIAAWRDETHVILNRQSYRDKFEAVGKILSEAFTVAYPPAGFYFWLFVNGDDTAFVKELLQQFKVLVLPGSYLGRQTENLNPGSQYVRIALVAPLEACVIAAQRMVEFAKTNGYGNYKN